MLTSAPMLPFEIHRGGTSPGDPQAATAGTGSTSATGSVGTASDLVDRRLERTGATTFRFRPLGAYSLGEAHRFACSASQLCVARPGVDDGHVHLAFVPDGEPERPVGACVRPASMGALLDVVGVLEVELYGGPKGVARQEAIVRQVLRVLSLDVDARTWDAVGDADPVIGRLQAQRPGFRPVNFVSPYEAAAWLLLTHRTSRASATAVRNRLATERGADVDIHGDVRRAYPGPAALVDVTAGPGLPSVKAERLAAVAQAAVTTDLLAGERIRSIEPEAAVDELIAALPGVGPFTAQGIVLRGAGAPDLLAPAEPRLAAAIRALYDLPALPTPAELARIAAPWAPYRSWAQVLIRSAASA